MKMLNSKKNIHFLSLELNLRFRSLFPTGLLHQKEEIEVHFIQCLLAVSCNASCIVKKKKKNVGALLCDND